VKYEEWPEFIRRRHALERHWICEKCGECEPTASKVDSEGRPVPARTTVKEVVDWLYAVLTVLDTKASALMRLNGVMIAAAAFLLGLFGRQGGTILSTEYWDAIAIILCALLSALSIGCCLIVVAVSWRFLGKVKEDNGQYDFKDELLELDRARRKRQFMYRSAWWVSLAAATLFLVEFGLQAYHVMFVYGLPFFTDLFGKFYGQG
jgi:hypothetical protein